MFRTIGKSWTQTCLNIDLRVYEVILDNAQSAASQNSKNIQATGSESQNQTGSID